MHAAAILIIQAQIQPVIAPNYNILIPIELLLITATSLLALLGTGESVAISITPSVGEFLTLAGFSVVIERWFTRFAGTTLRRQAADALVKALFFRVKPIGIALATSVHKSLAFARGGIVEEFGEISIAHPRIGTRIAHYPRIASQLASEKSFEIVGVSFTTSIHK